MANSNEVLAQVQDHYLLEGPAETLRDQDAEKFDALVSTALALLELQPSYSDSQDVSLAALAVTRQANLMLAQGADGVVFQRKKQGPKTWEWAENAPTIDPTAASIANKLIPDEHVQYETQKWLR